MSSSVLIAVGMALDNDDVFVLRLKTAFSLVGAEYTRPNAQAVVLRVLDQIKITEAGPAISTSGVEDRRVLRAVGEVCGKEDEVTQVIDLIGQGEADEN